MADMKDSAKSTAGQWGVFRLPALVPGGIRTSNQGGSVLVVRADTEKIRRSTVRGSSRPSTRVGTVDGSSGSRATNRCGAAAISARRASSSAREQVAPCTIRRPP